jgi:hypothetical protein
LRIKEQETRLILHEHNDNDNDNDDDDDEVRQGKAIQLHARKDPECSRRFRLPDFKTIGT